MKITGVTASPRKEGNTAWTVDQILEGARALGAETTSFYFSDLDIKPCRSCNACHKGDQGCIIGDDMRKLYNALEDANALVLGSPVYMGQMSAQAKIFTDRLYARFSPKFSPYFKESTKKKLILAFTQGNPDPALFQAYFDYTRRMFQLLEFDVKAVHVVAGMRDGPAHDRKELDIALRELGAALVSEETSES